MLINEHKVLEVMKMTKIKKEQTAFYANWNLVLLKNVIIGLFISKFCFECVCSGCSVNKYENKRCCDMCYYKVEN